MGYTWLIHHHHHQPIAVHCWMWLFPKVRQISRFSHPFTASYLLQVIGPSGRRASDTTFDSIDWLQKEFQTLCDLWWSQSRHRLFTFSLFNRIHPFNVILTKLSTDNQNRPYYILKIKGTWCKVPLKKVPANWRGLCLLGSLPEKFCVFLYVVNSQGIMIARCGHVY